jgi:C-terminal processing protease CtpA/Prc
MRFSPSLTALLLGILPAFVPSAATQAQNASEASALTEQLRLQRLETLADLWGKIGLFHPYVATRELDWDQVLVEAIPRVERARGTEEFVAALNSSLFGPLADPLSFARTAAQADSQDLPEYPRTFEARLLARKVGYISAPEPSEYFDPKFLKRVHDAVATLGPVEALIVDLRWRTKHEMSTGAWLALWADSTLPTGSMVSRIHHGYGRSRWQVEASPPLLPLKDTRAAARNRYASSKPDSLAPILTPTVFLTNLTSYPYLEEELDALQARRNVVVVLEAGGPFTESWSALTYPEGVRVRLNSPMLLSRTGALGSAPDWIAPNGLRREDLPALARRFLEQRAGVRVRPQRPVFAFEAPEPKRYPESLEPLSREERLRGLFKIWNTIGTFNAYQEYASVNWPNLLKQWIPKVEAAESLKDYYLTLRRISAGLNDSHVSVRHPTVDEQPWSIPALLMKVQGRVVVAYVDSTQAVAGLAVGDEVLSVDGRSIAEVEDYWKSVRASSHAGPFHRNVWELGFAVRGEKGTPVTLRVRGERGTREVTLSRSANWLSMLWNRPFGHPLFRELPDQVGYINMLLLPNEEALDSALAALQHTRGLILDMRGASRFWRGGDLRSVLVSRFVDRPVEVRKGEIALVTMHGGPPRRAWSEQFMTYYPTKNERGVYYRKPVVVLINARAQSAAEELPSVLRDAGRVTFVGSPTTGANGGAPAFGLPGGGEMSFTHERVLQRDGSRFHGIGIVPHVRAEPTQEGIRRGRDEVLEKGIEVLKRQFDRPTS